MGLNQGSRLRTAPGKQNVIVTLDAVGGSGQHYWLLDGKQTENANGKKRQSFIINTAGAHSITVIDAAGHVDSVGFVVDKRDWSFVSDLALILFVSIDGWSNYSSQ